MSRPSKKRSTLLGAVVGMSTTLVIAFGVFAGAGAAARAVAPTNTAPPTVTGTPQESHQLTADRGTWTASPTDYTYVWERCDKNGGSCSNISGATALTYTLGSADVGNSLRFKVDARNVDGTTSSTSVPTAVIAAAAKPAPPAATSPPTVTGTAQDGQTLTGDKGAWSETPTDYNYFWTRCNSRGTSCSNISGATATTYALTSRDVGNTIRFKVQASNSVGRTFASSLQTAVVAAKPVPPAATSLPTISGTAREGQRLTGDRRTWSGNPTDYNYFWTRCNNDGNSCSDISGSTAATYTLGSADVGNTIRFKVQASNSYGRTFASSLPTAVVVSTKPLPPAATSLPTISGTARTGQRLTGDRRSWSGNPTDYNYFWTRCDRNGNSCSDIGGATAAVYTLGSADIGNTIRFKVQASNSVGRTFASSLPTAVVSAAIVNHAPTIRILSTRFSGARIYLRMRVCDDSRKNLTIIERDSRPGVSSYTRRFTTLSVPAPCAALTRSWLPAQRFRHGRYTVTIWARDKSGKTSAAASKTFSR